VTQFPDIITHNYDPNGAFLKNLCDLPEGEAEQILDRRGATRGRTIKSNYLRRRLVTEEWLIGERSRKLGSTRLQRPIYFFLGDFADGRDRSRPCSLVIPLSVFSPDVLTFTYPDSMASLPIASRDDLIDHRQEYHGRVFTLQEIRDVVEKFGMPGERWKIDDPLRRLDRFIEVQVWDERPISLFLQGK
jgi:hypothetical protein